MNYSELQSIPELARCKPGEIASVFQSFLSHRQGGTGANIYGAEMAGRMYTIVEVWSALSKSRALSTSDLPEILTNIVKSLPSGKIRAEHRLFSGFIKVRDFKLFDLISGSDQIEIHETGELESIKPSLLGLDVTRDQIKSFRGRVLITREKFINDAAWLIPLQDNMLQALMRKEAELVYSALESATVTDTVAGTASAGNLNKALETFRGLKNDSGSYLNIQPSHYVVPAAVEVAAKKEALESGLNKDITVVGTSEVTACYLMSKDQPCIFRAGLEEMPYVDFSRPPLETDAIATMDGFHDVAAIFTNGPCVKVEL